jgi:hypothetical protein
MKKQTIAHAWAACVCCLLTGCAHVNDIGLAIFASGVNAIAVVDGQVLQGKMQLYPDHTGQVSLTAEPGAATEAGTVAITSCMGRMRHSGTKTASLDLRCSGSVATDLTMTLLGETRGYGHGQTATGAASLVFGMYGPQAIAHLAVPPNRQLVENSGSGNIELR